MVTYGLTVSCFRCSVCPLAEPCQQGNRTAEFEELATNLAEAHGREQAYMERLTTTADELRRRTDDVSDREVIT